MNRKTKDHPTLKKTYVIKVGNRDLKKWKKKKTPENRDYSRNRIETVIATTTGD